MKFILKLELELLSDLSLSLFIRITYFGYAIHFG